MLKLCNKKLNTIPSVSTINNWSVERAVIARRHISETCDKDNTTLHTDEASKYGSYWLHLPLETQKVTIYSLRSERYGNLVLQ